MSDAILQPGRKCWRHEHADRLAFLVNGAAYFSAVKLALLAAREQVFIVGWDIDSRIRLERRDPMPDVPDELLALIRHVAEARPDLRIYVLIWDFTLLYAGDREPIPSFKLNWQTPPNVRSEEHTSELQSLMRNTYAVFYLKKKNNNNKEIHKIQDTTQIQ